MSTLFGILFSVHVFITGLLLVGLLRALAHYIHTSFWRANDVWLNVGLLGLFGASAWAANYLRQHGQLGKATGLLGGIWLCLLLALLYAASKARWN